MPAVVAESIGGGCRSVLTARPGTFRMSLLSVQGAQLAAGEALRPQVTEGQSTAVSSLACVAMESQLVGA